jgi:predicted choloylglycine hydrolase
LASGRHAEATVLIDYVNGPCGDFTAVSVPGMVGVLSGVAKGRFSATINLAPAENYAPNILSGWSILLLLRYVFEYCKTYEDAVDMFSNSTSIAPAFVQVVGVKRGQACVIEIFPKGTNGIYEYTGKLLGITNHYLDSNYGDKEWEEDGETWCTNSGARLNLVEERAQNASRKVLKGA